METNNQLTAPSHDQKTWSLTLFLLSLGWQKAKVTWVMVQGEQHAFPVSAVIMGLMAA